MLAIDGTLSSYKSWLLILTQVLLLLLFDRSLDM